MSGKRRWGSDGQFSFVSFTSICIFIFTANFFPAIFTFVADVNYFTIWTPSWGILISATALSLSAPGAADIIKWNSAM